MKSPFFRQSWFLVLVSGLVLLVAADWALVATSNPNYLPTVILIGAFLVPVTFVVYTYGRVPIGEIPFPSVAVIFVWGGVLGSVVAGYLEYQTARNLPVLMIVGVGLIEESAKLVLPVIYFFRNRYCPEGDGILFGVAAGMGFAALETMGYALVAMMGSQGSVNALHQTLIIRGLLSPAGHAAWTGIVCGVLWRERARLGHASLGWPVIGAFLLVVFLHSLWDVMGSVSSVLGPKFAALDFVNLAAIGGVSLWLLIRRMHEAGGSGRPIASGSCILKDDERNLTKQ
ncbi:MAG: PrsW family intramembrane metalloprotease [Dehalococcoidales bacterium]|nr:PrsW family intramembrane metalloprotease [Dehalococcoidales bacterium]